jgi:hypothetical protein
LLTVSQKDSKLRFLNSFVASDPTILTNNRPTLFEILHYTQISFTKSSVVALDVPTYLWGSYTKSSLAHKQFLSSSF